MIHLISLRGAGHSQSCVDGVLQPLETWLVLREPRCVFVRGGDHWVVSSGNVFGVNEGVAHRWTGAFWHSAPTVIGSLAGRVRIRGSVNFGRNLVDESGCSRGTVDRGSRHAPRLMERSKIRQPDS